MRAFCTALCLIAPAMLATTPAVAITASQGDTDVKSGVDAWESGDFERAVLIWRPLAIGGDADAQFNLAQAYKLGRGVTADLAQAETWYGRAAQQGHLQAEDNLGLVMFSSGRREDAMPLIARSAERGEPRAQYVLGTALFNGDLVEKNWSRAYALTKRASDAGLELASTRLAQLDRLIPLEQRQRGLAMLPAIEKSEARERLAAAAAAAPPPPLPAAPRIQPARLPQSAPAASYSPPPLIAPADAPTAAAAKPADAPIASPQPAVPADFVIAPAGASSSPGQAAASAAIEAVGAANSAARADDVRGTNFAPPPKQAKAAVPPSSAAQSENDGPPKTRPLAPLPARPVAAGNWRIQLGAFGIEANARKLWTALEVRYPGLAARQPYLVQTGKLTRLQAGGFASRTEAAGFCGRLLEDAQPCLVVER